MFKKLLILALAVAAVVVASVPWWTTRMGEVALSRPDDPLAADQLQRAIRIKIFLLNYPEAGRLAEQGVIFFPESPQLPDFLFVAAKSAEKGGNAEAAIHWYRRFLATCPEHPWADQAKGYLEKLQGMADTPAP